MLGQLAPLSDAEVAQLGERGFFLRNSFLGPSSALALRDAVEALRSEGRFQPAGLSRGGAYRIDPAVRGDAITWLSPELPGLAELFSAFTALRDGINQGAYPRAGSLRRAGGLVPGGKARTRRATATRFRGRATGGSPPSAT